MALNQALLLEFLQSCFHIITKKLVLYILLVYLTDFKKKDPTGRIEIINNKARHNLMDTKCRRRSNQLYGAVSFREPFSQTKVMQIIQGETLSHQGAIIDAATSSGILKAKHKLGRTFNSVKLGSIAFTKISKLTMCSA